MELVLYKAADFLMNQSVHLAGLFVLVAVLARLLRNRSAHLRYLLWLLILIKCFVPPVVTVPLAVLPNELPAVSEEIHNLPIEQTNWAAEGDVLPAPAAAPQIPVSPPVEQPQSIAWAAEASDIIQRISGVGWLILFWLSGAGLYYLAAAVKAIRFHRTIYKLRRPVDGDLQEKIDALAERFRVKTRPRIWRLEEMSQPFVWGLVSGSIYLPADFADRVDEGKRLSILLHEMSHVKRFDPLFNFLQILAQGLYWFHPLVWIANRQIRAEREKCCDEIAIAKLQTTPKEYGSAIVEALTMEYRRHMTVPTLAVAGPVKNIEDRIKTIMQPGRRFAARPTPFALVSILLLAAMIAPTTIALTQRKGKTAGDSGQKTEDSNFTAALPNGVTVELLAVSNYPQNTKVWQPDGSNLTVPPLFVKPTPNDRKDNIGFVIKINGPEDLGLSYGPVTGSNGHSGSMTVIKKDGEELEGYKSLTALIPGEKDSTSITLGVSTAKWETLAAHSGHRGASAGSKMVIFSQAFETKDSVAITVSTQRDTTRDERIVAIDKDGHIHTPQDWSSFGSNDLTQVTVEFRGLTLNDIQEFQFQTRPYQWVAFKNVALRPGLNTDVKIETKTPQPNSSSSQNNQATVETYTNLLENQINLNLDKSPGGDMLSVQYAVQAINQAVGIPYQWTKSAEHAAGKQRRFINPLHVNDQPAKNVLNRILEPLQLSYKIDESGLYLTQAESPVDLSPADFTLQFDPKRGTYFLVVSIQNNTDSPLPKHCIRYYRGDPVKDLDETGHPHTGWHEAGPIEPGKTWNERTSGFVLPDGEYAFTVVLDYNQAIQETDEDNNAAKLFVKIQNGRIEEKSNKADATVQKKNFMDELLMIPAKAGALVRFLTMSEKDLVKGLNSFSQISGGRYPSDLSKSETIHTELKQYLIQMEKNGEYADISSANKKKLETQVLDTWFIWAYFDKLRREGREPIYSGNSITPEDSNKILLRWKQSENKYRVVFGNLTLRTLSEESDFLP